MDLTWIVDVTRAEAWLCGAVAIPGPLSSLLSDDMSLR